MAELNRRDVLKASAAVLGAGVAKNFVMPKGFRDVVDAVDSRTSYIENNPGASIHFDDPNKALDSMPVGIVGSYFAVEEELEQMSPREVAQNLPGETELDQNRQWHDLLMNDEANMKIVYMDEENVETDLQSHVEATETAFGELLPNYFDVNVNSERVTPDQEDLEMLESPKQGFGGLNLSKKHSDKDEAAVFLTGRDVRDGSAGYADYMQNVSYVELSGDLEYDRRLTVHELGHHRLKMPHNFMSGGVMSYNDEADSDMMFNEASERILGAMLDGEINYDVRTTEVTEFEEGEATTRDAPVIDIEAKPAQIDRSFAEQYVRQNVDEFVNQYIDASADQVHLGSEETEVVYSRGDKELALTLDGDIKGAEIR